MQIADNTVVSFHYDLLDEAGESLESSRGDAPTVYLHGANNIIRGLERAFSGREAGESFSVKLAPEDAYGLRNDELTQRVPIKHLVYQGKLRAGMVAQVNTSEGRRSVTVLKVGRHAADIDANHPLAGRALQFNVEVTGVREADPEEIAHGHAHGPGGHQH